MPSSWWQPPAMWVRPVLALRYIWCSRSKAKREIGTAEGGERKVNWWKENMSDHGNCHQVLSLTSVRYTLFSGCLCKYVCYVTFGSFWVSFLIFNWRFNFLISKVLESRNVLRLLQRLITHHWPSGNADQHYWRYNERVSIKTSKV